MKFIFDPNQPYQKAAIDAVIDLFEGQPINQGDFEVRFQHWMTVMGQSLEQNELGFGNNLVIDDATLQENLSAVQKRNGIFTSESIQSKGKNFSVEMETGTGKTYVYLRTIFELNQQYGFKKFIIVVPSIPIKEGVLKSINIMKEHFQELYNNIPFTHFVYDSKKLNRVTSFATGNDMQIMIINIDSFNKDSNIMNTRHERARDRKPVEFIQATCPIVIMDEPQNMESRAGKEAIASLNPLCTLRYSATHRDKYNLIYQLDPVKAFQMRLVKKISVASVLSDNDPTQSYVRLESVSNKNNKFTAKLKFFKMSKDGPKLTSGVFKQDENLFMKSNENEIYRNGFRVSVIETRPGQEHVRFANGIKLPLGDELGGNKDDVVKKQIRETIKAHFEKELQVAGLGIKVLSLFFLDRVENYRIYTESGYELGKYAKWFEEIYNELSEEYRNLFTEILPVEKVHNGYFSQDRKHENRKKEDTNSEAKCEELTFNLIMRDKEKLLSLETPLKFIFSHSALREGWDNPNVFQICTLNETVSSMKKRQEIGRGLRLPVNQNGCRVFDEYVNNLLVVANESYQDFVSALQNEFEEDCGVVFGRLPIDAFVGLKVITDDKEVKIDQAQSAELWNHLKSSNWIADDGFILESFAKAIEDHTFVLPEAFRPATRDIIDAIEKHQMDKYISKHNPVKGRVNEKVLLDPEFEKFWNAINLKTIYSVHYTTEDLIERAASAIKKMEAIHPPKLRTTYVEVNVETKGVSANHYRTPDSSEAVTAFQLPDILTYVQSRVELTRRTIYEVLSRSGRLEDFTVNPQRFMDAVVKEIQQVLHHLVIEGIQYEKLNEISYEMSLFRTEEHKLEFAKDKIVPTEKSVYNYIMYDSMVEKKFAEDLETMQNVKYFIKLPGWFRVPTPIGDYNPDWAILKQNGHIVYMIRETKATKDQLKLRLPEAEKIACGQKHFETIGISYDVATSALDSLGG